MPAERPPELVLSSEQSRAIDRYAIEVLGLPGLVLMENAGRGAAEALGSLGGPVGILCGPGNNGGDGFVLARHLALAGVPVKLGCTRDVGELRGDAAVNARAWERLGQPVAALGSEEDFEAFQTQLASCSMLVDALLGTGTGGSLREPILRIVRWLQAESRPVISLDLPTGLNGDHGPQGEPIVRANRTLTFFAKKHGLVAPGAEVYCGEVEVISIGIPLSVAQGL